MTRAERVLHAVTALREARAATDPVSEPAPVDRTVRQDAVTARDRATAREHSDVERWLDEGGSLSSEAGTQ